MFYTYILRSINNPNQRYIGNTSDLRQRLKEHNSNKTHHTAKYSPWEIEWYSAFKSKEKALDFERYLKSGSGHAFAKRHF
jgi:putative endonuclease